jgi:hypothetical protein
MRATLGPGATLEINTDTGELTLYERETQPRAPYAVPPHLKCAVGVYACEVARHAAQFEHQVRAHYTATAREPQLSTLSAISSREASDRAHAERLKATLEGLLGPLYTPDEQTGTPRPAPLTEAEEESLEALRWGEW